MKRMYIASFFFCAMLLTVAYIMVCFIPTPQKKTPEQEATVLGNNTTNLDVVSSENTNTPVTLHLHGDLSVDGTSTFAGKVNIKGGIAAENILYTIKKGEGITITGNQTPTITNTGVLSLQNKTGNLTLTGGQGIDINGLTINNTDAGSSQKIFKTISIGNESFSATSNNDTISFSAGDGLSLSSDPGNKKVTISQHVLGTLSPFSILFATASGGLSTLSAGNSGEILVSHGANSAPSWIQQNNLSVPISFSALTSGTNTTGNFVVGNGSSLTFSGSGILNASTLAGNTWDAPLAIGNTTPNTGTFTTLLAKNATVLQGNVTLGTTTANIVNILGMIGSSLIPSSSSYSLGSAGNNFGELFAQSAVLSGTNGGGDIFSASSSGVNKFVIDKSGNVGIGNNSPTQKLDVARNIYISSPSGTLFFQGTTNKYLGPGRNNDLTLSNKTATWFRIGSNNGISLWGIQNGAETNDNPNLRIDTTGRIGVGVTVPAFQLDVQDTQTATAAAQIYNKSTSTDADGLIVKLGNTSTSAVNTANHFISFETAGIGIVGSVKGNNAKGVTYTTNGIADFAEYFKKDPSQEIPFGSLVCITSTSLVTLCDLNNQKIVGIASEHPAFVGGEEQGNNAVAVGLIGIVKTKVTSANGVIHPGDMIGIGSKPGIGEKTTQASVGYAIESYDNADTTAVGEILVTVHVTENNSYANDSFLPPEKMATIAGNLSVSGKTTLNSVGITGEVTIGLLNINGLDSNAGNMASINTLSGPLQLQSHSLGGIDILNGKITIDTTGNILMHSTITADKLNINEQKDSIGEGLLPKGKTEILITSHAVTKHSRIFLTPETLIDTPLAVIEKQENQSFTVGTIKSEEKDTPFNWWIVN